MYLNQPSLGDTEGTPLQSPDASGIRSFPFARLPRRVSEGWSTWHVMTLNAELFIIAC